MNRTDIINALIQNNNYKSFLEIGVDSGVNQVMVQCDRKVGVDPDALAPQYVTHKMTSNEFFAINKETFDIIFVDGLHHADQVYDDIVNSLEVLNKGGVIVCHDMSPIEEIHQRVPRETRIWNGDCWKAWVQLRERKDLNMCVVDTDWGCGIITRGSQKPLKAKDLTFENLEKNRKEWLNLISVEEFLDEYILSEQNI